MTTQQKLDKLRAQIAELEQQIRDVILSDVSETQVEVSPEYREGVVVEKNWL